MRVRGLKLEDKLQGLIIKVAPHAGAWIETLKLDWYSLSGRSHPMRVRGLKLALNEKINQSNRSHPMRVRGLKLSSRILECASIVAPHAGAWIETYSGATNVTRTMSHPMRVRGLKQVWTAEGWLK